MCHGLLFLLDAGLYAFDLIGHLTHKGGEFIVKVPAQVKFKRVRRLADGSWLTEVTGQIVDTEVPPTPRGRKRWKTVTLTACLSRVKARGFRPFWLMTNLLDTSITARETVLRPHRHWDVEIAYDEIKTHQCAALRGQSPAPCATTHRELRFSERDVQCPVTRLVGCIL